MLQFFKASLKEKDQARRQYILNVLLFCSSLLSFVAFAVALIQDYILRIHRDGNSSLLLFILFIIFLISYIASRKGKTRITAYFFISFYVILISHAIFQWGPDMPIGLLVYALLIVMSGILINSKFAFLITLAISLYIALLIYLSISGVVVADQNWKSENIEVVDGIIFISIFAIIAIVSWLFNRETEKALRRARYSEAALQKERDTLALKVEEKTKKLHQEQAEKIAQLYKFAEFGKSASVFLHDFSNSVNLVSSNLRQLEKSKNNVEDMKAILSRARIGTQRLETFIAVTRKQVNNQDFLKVFSINNEILQTVEILSYKAKKLGVRLLYKETVQIQTYGNPLKFHQLISNLVSNAIDAYEDSKTKGNHVEILSSRDEKNVIIKVKDFGMGIPKKNLHQIYEPFFTTKGFEKGTGIGLSISHDIVTKDLKGTILVETTLNKGSCFIVEFPHKVKI